MTNNNVFIYNKNGSATIVFEIEAIEIFVLDIFSLGNIIKRFGKLEDNITGKPFTDHYISFIYEYITAFNIADKIDVFIFFKQGISGLAKKISFAFFFTHI